MTLTVSNDELPESPPTRRKLRHPRTAKACTFCKRRKVRCSGTHPCRYCQTHGVRCDYGDALIRPSSFDPETSIGSKSWRNAGRNRIRTSNASHHRGVDGSDQTFSPEHHVEPASGVSLLYLSQPADDNVDPIPSSGLTTYGDYVPEASHETPELPPLSEHVLNELLEQYFRFAMPTYRCLHQPSVVQWAFEIGRNDANLNIPKTACVFLACAQALLFSEQGSQYSKEPGANTRRSQQLYEKSKQLLSKEPGPAQLASVQARIAMCLYLLSTYRLNECRYTFGDAVTILASLGLQKKASTPDRLGLIEVESRRRTFWCAYVLDGYLSVMLGRPRLLRDQDIDQDYPRNFYDQDMTFDGTADNLPLHGNLEAFIAHVNLAKLMGLNNDSLYPLADLTEDQILTRTSNMITVLHEWKTSLPSFLLPREKTLAGEKTFERQNTVLKLACAHLTILATRRCLVNHFSNGNRDQQLQNESQTSQAKKECTISISVILTVAKDLLERDTLYQAFWFTQYIAIVAISTLYVLLLQQFRNPPNFEAVHASTIDAEALFKGAKAVQMSLAVLAPEKSQVGRHFKLLERLRLRVEEQMTKHKASIRGSAMVSTHVVHKDAQWSTELAKSVPSSENRPLQLPANPNNELSNPGLTMIEPMPRLTGTVEADANENVVAPADILPSPTSEFDLTFESMMNWGWDNLDALGFEWTDGP